MVGKAQRSRKKGLGEDDARILAITSLLVFLDKGITMGKGGADVFAGNGSLQQGAGRGASRHAD